VADVQEAGLFVFYIWHRVARFSFNKWQTGTEKKHEFYYFNGATFEMGKKDPFINKAVAHLRRVTEHMLTGPLQSRAEKLFERVCEAGDYVSRLTKHALGCMVDSLLLRECGLMSPDEFHDALDTGPYIGFTNGVQDTERDLFMPTGHVGHNVLVSMTTHYAYVYPDDPRVPQMRAELTEYYAKLFAEDASDPEDAHVRKARLMVGSYLYPCNVAKKLHVYLGHEGNNGKSAFTESLRRALGDYYVTGNISALTPGPRETLDVEIIRNHKALLCSFAEAQSTDRDGHSIGLKLDSGKLKVMTGNDTVCARGLYQNPRNVDIKNKPAAQTNNTPELDHNDPAASERVFVLGFGSRFSKTTEDPARRIYKCTPDLNSKLIEWAPFHFLLMMEWLRDFKAAGLDLPPGDQHTTGSFANRAIASQTPEGKVRAWVEANYTHVTEPREGTKLRLIYEAYRAHSAANTMGRNELALCLKTLYPMIKHRCAREGDVYLIRLD
jgi:phage/plasmid-associated DNA primase